MQISFYILFINLQFYCNVIHSRTVHRSNKNTIRENNENSLGKEHFNYYNSERGMNYRSLRNSQSNLNEMYGNGFGINAPSMLYNPQNVATKEERNYLFNDNIVGIVIDPHTRKAIGILENSLDSNNNYAKNYLVDKSDTVFLPYEDQSYNPRVIHNEKYSSEDQKNKIIDKFSKDKATSQNNYREDVKKRSNNKKRLKKENLIFHSRQNDDLRDYENGNIINKNRLQKRYTIRETKNKEKRETMSPKENNKIKGNNKAKNNNILDEKNESVNLKTQKNKGAKINNDYDRANIAVKSTDLEKTKREASKKHLPRDHENTVNDESSDLRKFTFNENNDGEFSLFEYGNNEKNEKNQERKQHAAAEKTYQYHDTDTRDRQSVTLLEKENSDINPDFSEDSSNLETHVRLRRHFPNFVRHRRSNAILPYQQSAFLQYHGAGADIEDNDGDEFDDDGLDDRTTNFIKKREVDRIGDDNDYDNTQTNYNSFANNNQQQNPGYFSQVNADNDQQQDNYNQFDDYSSPVQNDQQKRIGRDIIDEVSNSNFRSPRYENVQPNIKSSSQEYANRYDNTKLAQSFGEEPQTYKDEELTRLKRVKRQDDNFG